MDKLNEHVRSVQALANEIYGLATKRRRRAWHREVGAQVYAMALQIGVAASDPP